MKKIIFMTSLLMLYACDFQKAPDCWNPDIKETLSNTTYTVVSDDVNSENFGKSVVYKAVSLQDIVEIPLKTEAIQYKNTKICNVRITFSDGITRNFQYKSLYALTSDGRKASLVDFEEF